MSRRGLSAVLAAAAGFALLFNPANAYAATGQRGKPVVARFTADGLVVAATPAKLTVLSDQLRVGTRDLGRRTITVSRVRPAGGTAVRAGFHVRVAGTATTTGASTTFAAGAREQVQPQPAGVFLGTVTQLDTGLAQVTAIRAVDGDHDRGDRPQLTVATDQATISVDGAAGSLAVGQFVVVLGERSGDTVLAARIDAFTTPPTVVAGEISAVDGTKVTVGDRDDAQTVDLSGVPVILNGAATPVDVTALAVDFRIVILGSPTVAFAFNHDDTKPAEDHHGRHR